LARSNRAAKRHNKHDKNDNTVVDLNNYRKSEVQIIPRNRSQEDYLYHLSDPSADIVFGVGCAGTGKTLLAVLHAIKEFKAGKYKKIVISRPNVEVDGLSKMGALPGGIYEKMLPWCKPILDVFEEYYSPKQIEELIEQGIIEICPIAFVRGRTLRDAVIILDEAQGTTVNSLKAVMTRFGENSKMVITGDMKQTDIGDNNGLSDFVNRLEALQNSDKEVSRIRLVRFGHKDIERHPVVGDVLKIYKEED